MTQTVELRRDAPRGTEHVLSPEAVAFIADLSRTFAAQLDPLLTARQTLRKLQFLPETRAVRAGDWKIGGIPADLLDRRVEITGPVDRKMIINALNSGAQTFMADFEDSTTPTWSNLLFGQANLMDAVRGTIAHEQAGKKYALHEKHAVLLVRPRGLHLPEKHLLVDGRPVPGSLFDLGLFAFHNAKELLARGSGAYFYLPKLESYQEAAWWEAVLSHIEGTLAIPQGAMKATVLIETLPAAFEMDEILHALRTHIVGLNCGRWDYIFSTIKKLRRDATFVIPDRALVTMEQHFLRSYTQLLIQTCHRRGAFAMGGMAAQIPIKGTDAESQARNEAALDKVRKDKEREVNDGHDGTWVAHPGLVEIARGVFDAHLAGQKNQLSVMRDDVEVTAEDLLRPPVGQRTEAGLRHNVRVGVQYIAAWLQGQGCVPLYDLMEDAATAEISRSQVWQWLHHKVPIEWAQGGTAPLTEARLVQVVDAEIGALKDPPGFAAARTLFLSLCTNNELEEFLTLSAYEQVLDSEKHLEPEA